MRLLLDEMLPAVIAEQLRARGRDVVALTERSQLRAVSDAELFELVQREERAVVTYDSDFLALEQRYQAEGREHHGLVIVHRRRFLMGPAGVGPLVTALDALVEHGAPYPGFVHWLKS